MIQRLFSFLTLACCLLALLGLPKQAADPIRSYAVASFAPAWRVAGRFKAYLQDRPFFQNSFVRSVDQTERELETQSLRSQLDIQLSWQDWMKHLESKLESISELKKETNRPFFQRRFEEMSDLVRRQFFAVLAPVIYRDPSSWSSNLWIQVGEKDNEALGRTVVGKNSPVVLGSSLIGVVEFVGRHESRVRLITDSGLTVSVRSARGALQDKALSQHVSAVYDRTAMREDLFATTEQKKLFLDNLRRIRDHVGGEDGYYAKGQLQGSSSPFWRSRRPLLQGIGFNYDYADPEGPARELRSGAPIGKPGSALKILQEGDILVTSGLDGVFPPGIQVAVVTEVSPLAEGAYGYELKARPLADHLNDLETVFVLPPIGLER